VRRKTATAKEIEMPDPQHIGLASSFDDSRRLAALFEAAAPGRRSSDEIVTAFGNSRYRVFAPCHRSLVGAGRAFGGEVDCAVIRDLAVHRCQTREGTR
jgi:hypothetical protein